MGGFSERQLNENVFNATFNGNGYSSFRQPQTMPLARCLLFLSFLSNSISLFCAHPL
jgi:hypothetical protein